MVKTDCDELLWEFKPDERGEVKVERVRRKLGVKKGFTSAVAGGYMRTRAQHSGGYMRTCGDQRTPEGVGSCLQCGSWESSLGL